MFFYIFIHRSLDDFVNDSINYKLSIHPSMRWYKVSDISYIWNTFFFKGVGLSNNCFVFFLSFAGLLLTVQRKSCEIYTPICKKKD